jgi:rRNA maturation endonuclease Nob1
MERRIDEVRYWFLRCHECEHAGGVEATLRQLRSANLVCSECGAVIRKRRESCTVPT